MLVNWTQAATTVAAAFLASLVEFVEALTVILAVGATRGWRGALGGAALALVLLSLATALLGPAVARVPREVVQFVLGALLLLFGMRWLRKAILRAAGIIPLHDEDEAYAREAAALRARGGLHRGFDRLAVLTSFKITMIEGIEVVFIVIAIGSGGPALLYAAGLGALAAFLLVVLLGAALHRPIAAIPENALKLAVGVLLCAFGVFWIGEGIGLAWPGGDLALLVLIAAFLAAALGLARACRARALVEA